MQCSVCVHLDMFLQLSMCRESDVKMMGACLLSGDVLRCERVLDQFVLYSVC